METNSFGEQPKNLSGFEVGTISRAKYMTLLESLEDQREQLVGMRQRHNHELRWISQERKMERALARRVVNLLFFFAAVGWIGLVYVLSTTGGAL